ncbi:MAG TPA: DUF3306 domain-containing protein [Pseudolabrys sp.]|nr:DUF3306 domain-containing protein [Pseudolabrys sp.]
MSDQEHFLSRWSRRKRDTANENEQLYKPADTGPDKPATPAVVGTTPTAASEPELDLTKLPPLDSIGANTDIRDFLQPGVPSALKLAALRRAWSADPAIRDYIGPAEYAWDFTDPKAMPGFGDLGPDVDVKKLVAEVLRGMAPQGEPPADTPAPVPSSAQPARLSDKSDTVADFPAAKEPAAAQPERLAAAPVPNELVQHGRNRTTQHDDTKVESPDVKIRRHGGAMPE